MEEDRDARAGMVVVVVVGGGGCEVGDSEVMLVRVNRTEMRFY